MTLILVLLFLLAGIGAGLPIAFALVAVSIAVLAISGVDLIVVAQRLYGGVNSFPLLAVPLFILAGQIMNHSGISARLVDLARALVGAMRGGLAAVNIVTSMFFAGMSGTSMSDTAAVGGVLIPQMIRRGYSRAFTGAVTDSAGVIRTAAGGTLFLDEIGDLPLDLQPKLLRFLQEGEIQPLGEQRPLKVDVRIIAATNTDLEEMVAQSRFREDLYYRLNVIRLRVPPLRERRSEIPTIVNYYINHYSAKFGRKDIQITPQAVDLLMVSDWPGNVRQLCNEIQRVVARADDGAVLTPDQLSPELKKTSAPATPSSTVSTLASMPASALQNVTLADALADVERRMIADALRKHGGNISRAARELGLTRRGLYLKLERYQLSAAG